MIVHGYDITDKVINRVIEIVRNRESFTAINLKNILEYHEVPVDNGIDYISIKAASRIIAKLKKENKIVSNYGGGANTIWKFKNNNMKKPVKKKSVKKKETRGSKPGVKRNAYKRNSKINKKVKVLPKLPVTDTAFNDTEELDAKESLFCKWYVRLHFNGTQAAIKAGYSEKSASVIAAELLRKPNISKFIERLKKDIGLAIGVSAIDIAAEYAKIGFVDIRECFNEDGSLKNPVDFPDNIAAAMASVKIDELMEYQGRDMGRQKIGETKLIKLHPKIDALDKLAKMLGVDGITKIAPVDPDGKSLGSALAPTDLAVLLAEIRKAGKK